MNLFMPFYWKLFDFLTKDSLANKNYNSWQAHSLIATMFSTGVCMWLYAYIAYNYIDHPLPGVFGISMATIHLLSPLLLKKPGNISIATHTLIGSGCLHQTCFAYYTGGFHSNITIWFGLLPILGGIILGKKGAITWFIVTTSISFVFLILELFGNGTPNLINSTGWLFAQLLLVFAWIGISTVLIILYIALRENDLNRISTSAQQVKTLVQVLCHDIANPLTIIKGRLRVIERKSPELFDPIKGPLNAIEDTIGQVRNWEAIESGKLIPEFEEVDVKNILENLKDLFHERLEEKELDLEVMAYENQVIAVGDKAILQNQVFSNLLSNAIKFTPRGKKISFHFKEDDNKLDIYIKDEGLGIPDDLKDKIFKLDKKTTRQGTQGEKGTGLGLPIVKTYVEKMGGSIDLIDTQDDGTTFVVRLQKSS